VDAAKASDLLATSILGVASDLLMKEQDLLHSPSTLTAFFKLIAESVSSTSAQSPESKESGGSGLFEGKLRLMLLAAPDFVEKCSELAGMVFAERCLEGTVKEIFRFAAGVLAGGADSSSYQQTVTRALPTLCTAVCRALALQECLLDLEVLGGAAEVLTLAAVNYGSDFTMAIAQGLEMMQVPFFNRERLQNHVTACAAWGSSKMEWLEQLQQIVREWQNERRHANV
jgi:hypothetical protein